VLDTRSSGIDPEATFKAARRKRKGFTSHDAILQLILNLIPSGHRPLTSDSEASTTPALEHRPQPDYLPRDGRNFACSPRKGHNHWTGHVEGRLHVCYPLTGYAN
jgi:hypothetical protein